MTMDTISVSEESLQYARTQIIGLTTLVSEHPIANENVKRGDNLLREAIRDGSVSPGSPNQLYVQNIPVQELANTSLTQTVMQEMQNTMGREEQPVQGIAVEQIFDQKLEDFLHILSKPPADGEKPTSVLNLRTSCPGIPAVEHVTMTTLGNSTKAIDVLHMATYYSPLEYLLTAGASLPAWSNVDLDNHGLRVRCYKDLITEDLTCVIPCESSVYHLSQSYDCFVACMNENSRRLPQINCTPFTLLIAQLLHLARACFLPSRNQYEAMAAFLNCSRWKFHLLAVYASKESKYPTQDIRETVDVDGKGTEVKVGQHEGQATVDSEEGDNQDWFRITKRLIEHLFDNTYSWPIFNKTDAWMDAAKPFAFANAGCSLIDAREAVHVVDCIFARRDGKYERSAWPEVSLRFHRFFYDYKLPQERTEDQIIKDEEETKQHNISHLGTLAYVDELPRIEGEYHRMILSDKEGWCLSQPESSSLKIKIPEFYEGILHVRNSKFHFKQLGVRKRADRFWRSCTGLGIFHVKVEKNSDKAVEEDANIVAENVLSGKAGPEAARWVWQHLMFGSVNVSDIRPSYLSHLPVEADGMNVTTVISKEVVMGLEVLRGEIGDDIYIPVKAASVPDYRIEMGVQGFATLEKVENVRVESSASLVVGPAIG